MNKFLSNPMYVVAAIGVALGFGLLIADAYIRWTINQDFTLVGENALAALLLGSFGLLAALTLSSKSRN